MTWHRIALALAALLVPACAAAQGSGPPPAAAGEIEADGTVIVGEFRLPPSVYLSEEAAASLPRVANDPQAMLGLILNAPDPGAIRPLAARNLAPLHETMRQTYGVTTQAGEIAGVPVMWAIPDEEADSSKVLVNFPGGGFVAGTADGTGMTESIPVAGLTGVRVVSISYRQAPEHRFPAASEDSAAVYRALLEDYAPEDIAIFGCSAGGALAAQSIAWYVREGLPLPAAVGILCASADRFRGGDSMHYSRPFQGLAQQSASAEPVVSYFDGSDSDDPLVSQVGHPDLLARFPPALLITATRAMELSAAVNTHRELVNAGVEADLHVWDGLGHAFFYNPALPESREAYAVMAGFFRRHLGLTE
jgi:acetyl esterase/lipase